MSLIDVILADNFRPAAGGPLLIRYTAGRVYLALAQMGLEVRWIDLISSAGRCPSEIPLNNLAEVCCCAVFFGNKKNALSLMKEARLRQKPPRLIIAFGPFASVFSEEILSRGLADIVVTNDPEFAIPAILQKDKSMADLGTIPNLSYVSDGKIIHTSKDSSRDLDGIPFAGPYLYDQGHRPAILMTARGCQYHCVFCDRNVLWGGGVRNRSVENVLREIQELVEMRNVDCIHFLDEDLAADHQRLAALCQGMRRMKGKFFWTCSACVNSVNQKILLLMGRSGCRDIYFGVESASTEVLRRIGKTYGQEDILNAVRWSKEAGLNVEVMVTIGNPGETELDQDLTLSVLKELGPDVKITTNRLIVLPGTPFYRRGLREGWFTHKSYFEDDGFVYFDEKERR